jgi:hypothetical protein
MCGDIEVDDDVDRRDVETTGKVAPLSATLTSAYPGTYRLATSVATRIFLDPL